MRQNSCSCLIKCVIGRAVVAHPVCQVLNPWFMYRVYKISNDIYLWWSGFVLCHSLVVPVPRPHKLVKILVLTWSSPTSGFIELPASLHHHTMVCIAHGLRFQLMICSSTVPLSMFFKTSNVVPPRSFLHECFQ